MIARHIYIHIYRMSSASLVNQKVKEKRLPDSSDGNTMRKPAMPVVKGFFFKKPSLPSIKDKVKAAHLNLIFQQYSL